MPVNPTHALFDLTGKSAIVTGSGYGLGKQMALGLADAGASVMVCGRQSDHLAQTAEEIRARQGRGVTCQFDASDPDQCERLVAQTVSDFGAVDIAVINHGVIAVQTPEQTSIEDWRKVIGINLDSCFYCARAIGRQMIAQGRGGSIVITSSNGSLVGFEGLAAYGASKGGVDQLCRQLAMEWGQHGIRVNTINPGYTENAMGGRPRDTLTEDVERVIEERTPLGRRGRAEEFIGPVLFLVSDAASFVSGHSLTVDGGYSTS